MRRPVRRDEHGGLSGYTRSGGAQGAGQDDGARRSGMAVIELATAARRPYADATAFGDAGPYERLDGIARFAVDPAHPANAAIVDLDRAERGPDGRVHFAADICLLQPADPARGNGRLLVEVVNRGRKTAPRQLNRAPAADPTEAIDPGDGFLMRHGWTVAWCGWQWDVVRGPALLGLEAPPALAAGRPIPGHAVIEFQPNDPQPDKLLANRVHRPYPAADVDDPDAVLTVRDWPGGPRATIPRARWRFARDEGGRPVPDNAHIWLDGGFEPGRIYEVVYRTSECPVVGTGLLAVRDVASFLRHAAADAGNPCAGWLTHAYGYGVSQSGRFLRHFLSLGLNLDEAGRQVFDGLLPQVAGARRGQFNHRYAQPSDQATPSFGHTPPFSDDDLLDRQRQLGGVPKVIALDTAAEYWRGDAALAHTDPTGAADLEPPAEVRRYLVAGAQHGHGGLPLAHVSAADGARGAHGFNALDYTPLVRAALVNLDRWAAEGIEPPPSAVPRLADATAARPAEALAGFRALPGVTVPDPERTFAVWRTDLGPAAGQGVGRYPAQLGERYRMCVPAVDADGNEVAGVRLPEVAAPCATYTGWNPRHPDTGGAGQIIPMQGSTLPFAPTRAARERAGDPRPSIAERYRDRDDYLARAGAAADELVRRGYALAEDRDLLVQAALERYDAFAATPVAGAVAGGAT
jgi:hypothetical protein